MDEAGPLYLILLGAPGAGKGTQAGALTQEFGIPHVASGDLFREAIAKQAPLGALAKGYIDRGELVPDDATIRMVMERLAQADCAAGAILDGFPRTAAQAAALDGALAEKGRRIAMVLYIKASEETLLARLAGRWTCSKCGAIYHQQNSPPKVAGVCDACGGSLYQRSDDTPEVERRRVRVYMERTAQLIAHYERQGRLVEIDGEKDVETVRHNVLAAVEGLRRGGRS